MKGSFGSLRQLNIPGRPFCLYSKCSIARSVNSEAGKTCKMYLSSFFFLLHTIIKLTQHSSCNVPLNKNSILHRHTSRFVIIWLAIVPMITADSCKSWIIPGTCVLSYLLLSIEDISTQLEEPFSVLPLSTICSRVKQSITSLQGEHAAAKTVVKGFNQPTRKHQKQHGKGNSLVRRLISIGTVSKSVFC